MKLERLPNSKEEKPELLGAVCQRTNKVIWSLGDDCFASHFCDGTNWYQVWKEDNVVHVAALCWFDCEGRFEVAVTCSKPEILLRKVDKLAEEFYENIE